MVIAMFLRAQFLSSVFAAVELLVILDPGRLPIGQHDARSLGFAPGQERLT